jgi:predicted dehydrogenase
VTIGLATLQSYWDGAAAGGPLIIFGAGRWGRVWVDVVAAARGNAEAVAIVARQNHPDTLAWKNADIRRHGLFVAQTPEQALAQLASATRRPTGIVASRPGDHARDIAFCTANALPALVEKPFTADAQAGLDAIARAENHAVMLGIGTEFAFLPALHFMLSNMDAAPVSAEIDWHDPPAEERHGAAKRIHDEISVLEDILPHALSILREIAGYDRPLGLSEAGIAPSGDEGHIIFAAPALEARLRVSRIASERRRHLTVIDALGRQHALDFARGDAMLSMNGQTVQIPTAYSDMTSTLRLELGAWNAVIASGPEQARSIASPSLYVRAQADLTAILR